MKELKEKNYYNWDNNFSVRFRLDNNKQLQYIPNNIFMIELPEIDLETYGDSESNTLKYIYLTLRSTTDLAVEKELYNDLSVTPFSLEVSLSNANICHSIYNGCIVESIKFSPLTNKSKSSPFNIIVKISVAQSQYVFGADTLTFGQWTPDDKNTITSIEGNINE